MVDGHITPRDLDRCALLSVADGVEAHIHRERGTVRGSGAEAKSKFNDTASPSGLSMSC